MESKTLLSLAGLALLPAVCAASAYPLTAATGILAGIAFLNITDGGQQ